MRALRVAFLIIVVGIILALTLAPSPRSVGLQSFACVFCSQRAAADAIANVILFLPLGLALASVWPAAGGVWRWGLALSLGVELLQLGIAGRDASIGDVLTNTLGTQLGWGLWQHVAREVRRPPRFVPAAVAAVSFATMIALVVGLLAPQPTRATYYGGWTLNLGHLAWYRGRVLSATVNDVPIPVGLLADTQPVRRFVRGHGTLRIRALAGPRVPALAPLVSVFDHRRQEILLVGPDRDALVLRYRQQAAGFALDESDVRLEQAFHNLAPGDTLAITVERHGASACLSLNERRACLPVATPGRGWALLSYPEGFPAWLRRTLDWLFVAGLAIPVGWYAGFKRRLLGGLAVALLALLVLPRLGAIAPAPVPELAAALLGAIAGAAVSGWLRYPAIASASTATQLSMRS